MKIAKMVRDYIEDNGYIKNVIAKKSGMQEKKFYRILGGTQEMTVEDYETICRDGLGLDPSYFYKQKLSKNESKQSA